MQRLIILIIVLGGATRRLVIFHPEDAEPAYMEGKLLRRRDHPAPPAKQGLIPHGHS